MDRLHAAASLRDMELLRRDVPLCPADEFELCHRGRWRYPDGVRFFQLWRNQHGYLADCQRLGQFFIEATGRRVTYHRDPASSNESFEDYFTTTILAIAHELRGRLCLHASCITRAGETAAFVGDAGAGKSTLAAHGLEAGASLLADDVTVLSFEPGRVEALPTGDQLKLRPDVASQRWSPESLSSCAMEYGKYWVAAGSGSRAADLSALSVVYILDRHVEARQVTIEPLTGHAACSALMRHTYLSPLVSVLGLHRAMLEHVAQLVDEVPVRRLRLSPALDDLPRVVPALLTAGSV